jgi:hypothetical protein
MNRWISLGAAAACIALFGSIISSTKADDGAGWGTVKGQVVWGEAELPKIKVVDLANHQDKAFCLSKGPVLGEEWVVNPKNKGIRWTYVWLITNDPNDPKAKLPIHPSLQNIKDKEVSIDQPCCQYEPHALAMRQGQELVAKNSASIAHNVKWNGHPLRNPGNNVIIPAKGSYTIKDLKADTFPVKVECNIHPWMSAWVRVFDHPYFTVSDADGNFEIKNAPAGDYRVVIWHESIGYRGGAAGKTGEKITIKNGGVADIGQRDLKNSKD